MVNKTPFPINVDVFGTQEKRDKRRAFTLTQRNEIWDQQGGKCAICRKKLEARSTEYDHVKPWADRGRTITVNGAALCANCHKIKTHKERLVKINNSGRRPHQQGNPWNIELPKIDLRI
ncbi:MAG: HNH endonuclease [Candidatus Aenigmarchaeota archaeon]|nr:HNH endonuclease [Candidatus Aenigmarchaeota archaeon]